jgi:hypothetical protein
MKWFYGKTSKRTTLPRYSKENMGKKTLKRIVFDQYQMEKYEKIEF